MRVWKQKPVPYIYSIEKDNQLLVYYGADHSFDPKHKQWEDIKKYFNDFLKKTEGKNCVVLVEGGGNQLRQSEEVAIKEGGEPLFMTFLATQNGIKEIYSPEPDELEEINLLLKDFSKEEIMHQFFTRLVHQWQRYKEPRPDFEDYMNKFLDQYKKITKWSDFDFSIENLKQIHQKLVGKTFEDTNEEQYYHMVWPTTKFPWVSNKVALKSSKIRNDFIQSEIKRYWDQGKNIFVIFGHGHAVENEKYLRANLK